MKPGGSLLLCLPAFKRLAKMINDVKKMTTRTKRSVDVIALGNERDWVNKMRIIIN